MSKTQDKIPCSVSLLTLNSGEGLRACLESLKDFEEILVCDGNSTDNTQDIARAFGARIIKQYDTDEPNVPCAMDKATVRQKAMDASTLPWRFFMDADDTLSPEAAEEIRAITSDPNPKHLIWRMPTRIFIGDKEIKYEATYPSYQTRLVHESVGAKFKGPVHDHLVWNVLRFPAGTMQSYYNFGWPKERVEHFWRYQRLYVRRELATTHFTNFFHFIRWGIWFRLRVIAGYVLWRLPSMYLRYGFKDSMSLSLELQIVGYHMLLLTGSITRYIKTRAWFVIGAELLKGRSLNLAQRAVWALHQEAYGTTLLVGEPHVRAVLWPYIGKSRWHTLTEISFQEFTKLQRPEYDSILVL